LPTVLGLSQAGLLRDGGPNKTSSAPNG